MTEQFCNLFDFVFDKQRNNFDELLQELKQAGVTQMESTMVLIKKLGFSLTTAD